MNPAPSIWTSVTGVTLAQTVALVAPSVVTALANPTSYAVLLLTALLTVWFWEGLFAVLRKRKPGVHGITTALIIAVLAPPDLVLWQLAIALSLGVVLAELVFGGRGFGFLSPAVVAASLLVFSFPEVTLAPGKVNVALATIPGALLLLFLGLISWRILVGAAVGTGVLLMLSADGLNAPAIAAAMTFCLVFVVCDPTAASATNPGRWFYGLLTGGLIILFSDGPVPTTEGVVFAALIASIFAPLIDHLVVLVQARRWKTAHA
ncbi:Na+-transporting NADH:ubiquinone oxidoreductase subunit B [Yoonia maricola]|uniref:Na+-transporting NADH:ubiquinone oxidoreductase subunit B n=1 Tax=Yoonia maricola TaxID=420999 RepID=A0A2M8W0B6_9RHOB|nr:RnfABCDGE type electron transport complex subunit D [Yoonia maricola]PJI84371.1 Na+-transporting NADH:ubiquinone oxidoreductase subunit B [Yoonia maricola]